MAARPKTPAAVAGPVSPLTRTDTPMDYKAVLAPSSGLKKVSRSRDGGENPLKGFVARALGNALMLSVPNGKEAKKVTNWLRQDQGDDALVKDARLTIQYQDGTGNVVRIKRSEVNGKTVTEYPESIRQVHFLAEPGKKQSRKYTNADIVKWFKENRNQELSGPISKAHREEYRVANGFAKVDG
jgi:hypothetical protein